MERQERINKALKIVEDERLIEIIYDVLPDDDYIEISGKIGGDHVTYRIYDDGSIFSK